MLEQESDSSEPPEWLEKLESSRNRAPRLAHDVGSGSPCLKCLNDCKGLDLHFWRKICRNCKCTKDDHDVKDDGLDVHFNIVFGQRPFTYNQSKIKISLKNPESSDKVEKEVQLEWLPPTSSSKAAEKFVKSFPENRIPIVGSSGASHRVRQLKKQIPIHDFDSSFCHDLNQDEKKRLEEYSSHSRLYALGQGEVIIASSKLPNAQPDLVRCRLQYGTLVNINSSDGLVNINSGDGLLSPSDALDDNFPPPPPDFPPPPSDFPPPPPDLMTDDVPTDADNLPPSLKNLILDDVENSNVKRNPTPGKLKPGIFSAFDSKNANTMGTDDGRPPLRNRPSSGSTESFSTGSSLSPPSTNALPASLIKDGKRSPADSFRTSDGEGNAGTVKFVPGAVCCNCTKAFNPDEVAVIIKTKQGLKYWHPNCFVCDTCKEFLVDLIYFIKDGKIFCGRDYAKECNIPRCFACDELIFSNEYTMAEMKTYHVRHFCCFECDQSLGNQEYIVKYGNPVCLPCFQIKYAKMCSSCGTKIGAHESGIDVGNISWHANTRCFVCKFCNKSLLSVKFVLKHNFPFCSKDCYLDWNSAPGNEVCS